MFRFIDIVLASLGLILGSPLLLLLAVAGWLDTGSPIFRQVRVGRFQQPFTLIKFRTMELNTPSVATHLASSTSITRFGRLLRKTKLDELPQLWNVLKGDMSLVGPRPGLLSQQELTIERARWGVYDVRPGITGLAQIRGVDMSTPALLAEVDGQMIQSMTLSAYFRYILLTACGKGGGDRIDD